MDKTYVGSNASGIETSPKFAPYSKVILLVDEENAYIAGDDSGRTLEAELPWATQEIADNVLASIKGFSYQPLTGTEALIDPAAELGDGITLGGVYSTLASSSTIFDALFTSDVSAPHDEEIDHEYPYVAPSKRDLNRKIAQTRSLITKTASEIRLEVSDLDSKYTALSVTLDGVTVTDDTGTTKIKGSSIETESLYVDAANIAGTLQANQIVLTGSISWDDLDSGIQGELNETYWMAYYAQSDVEDITYTYNGKTYIDESRIMAGSVIAGSLMGGSVSLLDASESVSGVMTISNAATAAYAVDIESYAGLRLIANSGMYLNSGYGTFIQMVGAENILLANGNVYPSPNNAYSCGTASFHWSDVYAANATIQTSDREKKTDIVYGLENYDLLFDALRPVSFLFKDGTSGRRHLGMIAQDVETSLTELGYTTLDFAGFIKSPRRLEDGTVVEGEYEYALRYGELIPLCVEQIQRLKKRVAELEGKV